MDSTIQKGVTLKNFLQYDSRVKNRFFKIWQPPLPWT